MPQERITQAVVVIHGIGEQRPMDTLRSFVDAVLPDQAEGGEKYFSKPDRLSESFELRKLQNRSQPRTHFYEYYWAYKVEGTTLSHIWSWLSSLLFRRPSRVPKQLLSLWVLSWFLIGISIFAAFAGVAQYVSDFTSRYPAFLISAVSTTAFAILQGGVIHYLGDSARYLSPSPRNIKLRQEIRTDCIKLLKSIHESGDYDRVIVVGHSLGSVIAYDALKHLWQEYYRVYEEPAASEQGALRAVEDAGEVLSNNGQEDRLEWYQEAQIELWRELRELGNPWLVTDLITLGSPLAHSAMLLASDSDDLKARQRQRELPTNPPVPEIEVRDGQERHRYSFRVWERYKGNIQLRAVHHAGLFACTRWANLYYPAYWNLFGDIVAGPLNDWFGLGIRDLPVTSSNLLVKYTLKAHTAYWRKEATGNSLGSKKQQLALPALVKALDLDGTSVFLRLKPS